jgi:hypothetical protein
MLWESGRGSEAIILRELQVPVASDRTTSDRIGEGNNQRNEREHHSKSALLLASFHICRKTVPIPKVPPLKTKIQSYADSAPLVDYHGSR